MDNLRKWEISHLVAIAALKELIVQEGVSGKFLGEEDAASCAVMVGISPAEASEYQQALLHDAQELSGKG